MKKILNTLLTLSFLDILGFSFILPVLPFIVKEFSWNAFTVWIVVSAAAAWMFLGWMLFWRLSDRYWRKNIILSSILLNMVWYIIFWLSKNIEIFIISRFICWLWGWWISVVQAYVWDISDDKNRMRNMWLIWASIWLWFTIWPILGSFLEVFWLRNMWFFSAFILFISFLISYMNLWNHKLHHHEEIKLKGSTDYLKILFFSFFIITATFAWMQTIFALYLNDIFKFWPKQVAYAFWYLWIIAIIYQWFFIWKINKYIREKSLILIWLAILLIGFLSLWKIQNLIILYFILALLAIWLSSVNSSIFALISKHSPKKDFWRNMWINTAFWSVADIAGPFISWILYSQSLNFPFYFFWFLLFLNIIMIYFLLERKLTH
ncbi:MAG: Adventurous gliding motility protein P [uncultured bacterium (gcode 4)]|uniref:Adventurous gliding motility protein P n=1 Tax=uncultured bacterium (gcode 4) TaxID=1234023 RepID=K2G0A9_9BACT|nr:MAG: Adventurous gliding motility protein P [uncultured bacterium (gcode 4)]